MKYTIISAFSAMLLTLGACQKDEMHMNDLSKTLVYEITDPAKAATFGKVKKWSIYQEEEFLILWENKVQTLGRYDIENYEDVSNDTIYQFSFDTSIGEKEYKMELSSAINSSNYLNGKYYGELVISEYASDSETPTPLHNIEVQIREVTKTQE